MQHLVQERPVRRHLLSQAPAVNTFMLDVHLPGALCLAVATKGEFVPRYTAVPRQRQGMKLARPLSR